MLRTRTSGGLTWHNKGHTHKIATNDRLGMIRSSSHGCQVESPALSDLSVGVADATISRAHEDNTDLARSDEARAGDAGV